MSPLQKRALDKHESTPLDGFTADELETIKEAALRLRSARHSQSPEWVKGYAPKELGQYLVAIESQEGSTIACYRYSPVLGWAQKNPSETIVAYMRLEDAVSALPSPWESKK
ncbi:hypothetical protein O5O45_12065 [Hahella aquimaris]|uniref:hypothetical protein n=1 Tax=Hahella sp. HNIBRBA332 TaxID=3015983 RepID=UPI00273CA653|nr:hypothetical protein [Hahella sp. HNIBRBA332]WLQ16655.1 hypothetical protein O5O45_12065 [Hahella sp. HNIBRBA332]